jgi:hypothetical protein
MGRITIDDAGTIIDGTTVRLTGYARAFLSCTAGV